MALGSNERTPDGQEYEAAGTTPRRRRSGGYQRQGVAETAIKSIIRSIAGRLGRAIVRAIVGRR